MDNRDLMHHVEIHPPDIYLCCLLFLQIWEIWGARRVLKYFVSSTGWSVYLQGKVELAGSIIINMSLCWAITYNNRMWLSWLCYSQKYHSMLRPMTLVASFIYHLGESSVGWWRILVLGYVHVRVNNTLSWNYFRKYSHKYLREYSRNYFPAYSWK